MNDIFHTAVKVQFRITKDFGRCILKYNAYLYPFCTFFTELISSTLIKYMSTNSHRTVVMPSRAKPFPTLRTVFFRENFLAKPSTVIMNFIPYACHLDNGSIKLDQLNVILFKIILIISNKIELKDIQSFQSTFKSVLLLISW